MMKKSLKILVAAILLAVMLLGLTGCFIKYSKEDAMRIAAEDAGYNTSQVNFVYTKRNSLYEYTYYVIVYQVDGFEFNYSVNAETGEIIYSGSEEMEEEEDNSQYPFG